MTSRTLMITVLLALLSCAVVAAPHRLNVTPGEGMEERAFALAAELGGELVGLDTKTGAVIVEITEESVARVANRGVRAIPCRTRDCFSTAAVAALVTTSTWDSGLYRYDGAGNIAAIGAERYAYDGASRLKSGTLERAGAGREQAYTYDAYGNITSIATLNDADRPARTIDASPASNRIATVNGTAWSYDARGNVTSDGALGFTWDALNVMRSMTASGGTTWYVYTADDERLAVIAPTGATSWTVRGLNQKVLREYDESAADATTGERSWTWTKDYLYRGELLAAAFTPTEGMHAFHLDHLGTPRLITDTEGYKVGLHDYYPFGEEASDRLQNEHALKFTGHERDYVTAGNQETRSLDYMHARYYSNSSGRFFSVDPVAKYAPVNGQRWNRYVYAVNRPLSILDPDGREGVHVFVAFTHGAAGSGVDVSDAIYLPEIAAMRAAGVNVYELGQYDAAMAADIVSDPTNDVIVLSHASFNQADLERLGGPPSDILMFGLGQPGLIGSGVAGAINSKSFSVIACRSASLTQCGAPPPESPGAYLAGPHLDNSHRMTVFSSALSTNLAAAQALPAATTAAQDAANAPPTPQRTWQPNRAITRLIAIIKGDNGNERER